MPLRSDKPMSQKARKKISEKIADYKFFWDVAPVKRVLGGLEYDVLQRYDIIMPNKDVFSVNRHGAVCRWFNHVNNDLRASDDIFAGDDGLEQTFCSTLDNRLRDLRDRHTKYQKRRNKYVKS